VAVKVRWDLSADQAEVTALRAALGTCGGSPSTAPPPAPAPTTTTTTAPSPPTSGGFITVTALDCGGERVTVANGGSVAVDMTGWTIHDEGTKHTFTFPAGYTLTPSASVAVKSGGAAGPGELAWTAASVWNNDGDTAYLVDAAAEVRSTRGC
jgi:competence protein ComEC